MKAVASNVLVDGGYYPAPARFPGNVGVRQISGSSMVEVTIGMTYVGKVGRYILDRDNKDGDWSVIYGETLLSGGMTLPDANAISISGDWIAVSDPNEHAVLIYRNTGELNALTEPSGVLKGVRSPHGLVFLADDRFLLVNDASYPYVYTYEAPFADWTGHRTPIKSTRVMNDETFFCNAFNSEEGGPKGMELLQDHDVLVLTSHCQPMAVFGLDHFGI